MSILAAFDQIDQQICLLNKVYFCIKHLYQNLLVCGLFNVHFLEKYSMWTMDENAVALYS